MAGRLGVGVTVAVGVLVAEGEGVLVWVAAGGDGVDMACACFTNSVGRLQANSPRKRTIQGREWVLRLACIQRL